MGEGNQPACQATYAHSKIIRANIVTQIQKSLFPAVSIGSPKKTVSHFRGISIKAFLMHAHTQAHTYFFVSLAISFFFAMFSDFFSFLLHNEQILKKLHIMGGWLDGWMIVIIITAPTNITYHGSAVRLVGQ